MQYTVGIVGGGAAGCMAAIAAARAGKEAILCEKMPVLGKKILASGNGRCNLLNEMLAETYYNAPARELVRTVFGRVGKKEILALLREIGIETYHDDEGRVFPVTNQAASVVRALEMELRRLGVTIAVSSAVTAVANRGNIFELTTSARKKIQCVSLVIAAGGASYPALGSDGSAYALLRHLGHRIIEPVPAAVPLIVRDPLCHALQGQKIRVRVQSMINGVANDMVAGDLLFTSYGLSGTAILDVSEAISIAYARDKKRNVTLVVDLIPFLDHATLCRELERRRKRGMAADELLVGILPNKCCRALTAVTAGSDIEKIAGALKARTFTVQGTRGWNEAEFTAGGVPTGEVESATLASTKQRRLYLAGETLDVTGRRGGYNLAWAWASGLIAGEEAARA